MQTSHSKMVISCDFENTWRQTWWRWKAYLKGYKFIFHENFPTFTRSKRAVSRLFDCTWINPTCDLLFNRSNLQGQFCTFSFQGCDPISFPPCQVASPSKQAELLTYLVASKQVKLLMYHLYSLVY
jgi:hypothetical protein